MGGGVIFQNLTGGTSLIKFLCLMYTCRSFVQILVAEIIQIIYIYIYVYIHVSVYI
jgi:hypothetical protein